MKLTLLLDLDDTLLSNDMEQFQKAYLQRLADFLSDVVEPQAMLKQMSYAVRCMLSKDSPIGTLQDTFDAAFYAPLHLEKEALQDRIAEFYATIFPSLRSITRPRPAALRLVEQAFQRGYRVVIATNPLFPRTAILQRLDWAGLRPDAYPFALITSYETFHFCKPNPAYYCEILAQLGWPEDNVVMVGNSLPDDILPAARLQFSTYYLNSDQSTVPAPTSGAISGSGTLEQVLDWLTLVEEQAEKPSFDSRRVIPSVLKATPAALDGLCAGLPAQAWKHRPAPQEWSLTEIVYHLSDLDNEVNLPRLQKILAKTTPSCRALSAMCGPTNAIIRHAMEKWPSINLPSAAAS